jgi:hypothetical protein
MFLTGYLKLGTLEEFEERMSSSEYELWKEKYWESPFGDERRMLAMLCTVLANCHRGKDDPAFTIDQFLPQRQEEKNEPQPMAEQKALAEVIVACLGGNGSE